jgi:hypothetical protein
MGDGAGVRLWATAIFLKPRSPRTTPRAPPTRALMESICIRDSITIPLRTLPCKSAERAKGPWSNSTPQIVRAGVPVPLLRSTRPEFQRHRCQYPKLGIYVIESFGRLKSWRVAHGHPRFVSNSPRPRSRSSKRLKMCSLSWQEERIVSQPRTNNLRIMRQFKAMLRSRPKQSFLFVVQLLGTPRQFRGSPDRLAERRLRSGR